MTPPGSSRAGLRTRRSRNSACLYSSARPALAARSSSQQGGCGGNVEAAPAAADGRSAQKDRPPASSPDGACSSDPTDARGMQFWRRASKLSEARRTRLLPRQRSNNSSSCGSMRCRSKIPCSASTPRHSACTSAVHRTARTPSCRSLLAAMSSRSEMPASVALGLAAPRGRGADVSSRMIAPVSSSDAGMFGWPSTPDKTCAR
mmetsp:Transcript_1131/g.3506  ORF Transcript_1131/g.3506 Transcript_1131/m.3506 type:complete len:204 (+) Transcript_1131:624-1235(+)